MLLFSSLFVAICILSRQSDARAVFAHFMVSNTVGYEVSDWEDHMTEAYNAHIDAFALNIASGDDDTATAVGNAFIAAENVGFSLFFSFDYAGNGAWEKSDVISLIESYSDSGVYWQLENIKDETNCFFVPDWSSLGADEAMQQADGVADGLFSWAAWPYGPADMDTYTDASYDQFLDGKPYMMPVSPWFFTNMPGYDKNWLWRGDDLWYDRWQQVLYLQPEFVEIISWNVYGESHYIGPSYNSDDDLAAATYVAFGSSYGDAPYNYALGYDHSGWRALLPFLIDTYKKNQTTITQEGLSLWYRLNAAGACSSDGGTTGNTVSQLQLEYWPYEIPQDKVFYSAVLGSTADVVVTVGGVDVGATWTSTPSGNAGIYHGSVSFTGYSGEVSITITRSGSDVVSLIGEKISSGCSSTTGIENWNAWVGSAMASDEISVKAPKTSLADQVCIEGWGKGNFDGLCQFTCNLGYCPAGACVCSKMGPEPTMPTATGTVGYPISGESASYSGLCSFACNYGYCPSTACGTVEVTLTVPTVSPFVPDTCTAGEDSESGSFAGLCSYSCNYGFCPIHNCTCTATGPLNNPPSADSRVVGVSSVGEDNGLCSFVCERGYCPIPTCEPVCEASDSSATCSEVLKALNITVSSSDLSSASTCTELSASGLGEKSWMWDQMDIPSELKTWIANNPPTDTDSGYFPAIFSDKLGNEQSFGQPCTAISEECRTPDCASLDINSQGTAGSAWQYLVEVSWSNLNKAFYAVQNAALWTAANYTALAPSLFETYYPSYDSSLFELIEIITAIGVGIAGIGALTGNPIAGGVSTIFAGAATEFTNYLSTVTSPDSEGNVQDFSISAWDWAGTFTDTLEKEWEATVDMATEPMMEDFGDGAWVDSFTIPILNTSISASDLRIWFNNVLTAATVNYLWTQSDIYIYCMEMTADDFDDNTPSSMEDLSYYTAEGYGCYYQGISPETSNETPIYMDPPGYKSIEDAKYSFDTSDMIQSSLISFINHGFNYTAPVTDAAAVVLAMSYDEVMSDSFWQLDGQFTLPVCIFDADSVEKFFYYLNTPTNDGYGAPASWCLCEDDKNGKAFSTFVTAVNDVDCICSTAGCVVTVDGVSQNTTSL